MTDASLRRAQRLAATGDDRALRLERYRLDAPLGPGSRCTGCPDVLDERGYAVAAGCPDCSGWNPNGRRGPVGTWAPLPCGECDGRRTAWEPDQPGVAPPWCSVCRGTGHARAQHAERLLAYLGDETAREIVGDDSWSGYALNTAWTLPLADWAHGLVTLGGRVPAVRAATAVGRLVLPAWEAPETGGCEGDGFAGAGSRLASSSALLASGCSSCNAPRRALDAAEAWARCPCERHACLAGEAALYCAGADWAADTALLAGWPTDNNYLADPMTLEARFADAVKGFARISDEKGIRTAIREALTEWIK